MSQSVINYASQIVFLLYFCKQAHEAGEGKRWGKWEWGGDCTAGQSECRQIAAAAYQMHINQSPPAAAGIQSILIRPTCPTVSPVYLSLSLADLPVAVRLLAGLSTESSEQRTAGQTDLGECHTGVPELRGSEHHRRPGR